LDSSDESSEISSINNGTSTTDNGHPGGTSKELTNKQKHQLKQRELFLSRQVETLPATHIRGKCSVTLLNETESLLSYLNKEVSETAEFLLSHLNKVVSETAIPTQLS
jgi:BAH domain.